MGIKIVKLNEVIDHIKKEWTGDNDRMLYVELFPLQLIQIKRRNGEIVVVNDANEFMVAVKRYMFNNRKNIKPVSAWSSWLNMCFEAVVDTSDIGYWAGMIDQINLTIEHLAKYEEENNIDGSIHVVSLIKMMARVDNSEWIKQFTTDRLVSLLGTAYVSKALDIPVEVLELLEIREYCDRIQCAWDKKVDEKWVGMLGEPDSVCKYEKLLKLYPNLVDIKMQCKWGIDVDVDHPKEDELVKVRPYIGEDDWDMWNVVYGTEESTNALTRLVFSNDVAVIEKAIGYIELHASQD